jgi:hypothetical protein
MIHCARGDAMRLFLVGATALGLLACSDEGEVTFNGDADVSAIGSGCGSAFACPRGLVCVEDAGGASRCMIRCDDVGGLCADGPLCVELVDESSGVCYLGGDRGRGAECTSSLQCAEGMGCIGAMTRYCVPLCRPSDGFGCDAQSRCVPLTETTGRCQDIVGAGCEADAECGDGFLCQPPVDPWFAFSGSCTRACAIDSDCGGGDAVCFTRGDASFCADGCARSGHCRAEDGFECLGGETCAGRPDEADCRAMFGVDRVCVRPG